MSAPAVGVEGTGVEGVRVGHWTDPDAATGCTVVLLPPTAVASCEVRGGAPASRETDVLDPSRTVAHVDAVLLTGGSAYGLAAADGVVRWCEEQGLGYPTPAGPVPIVPALGLFDLGVGDPTVRPGPEQGYAACAAATDDAPVSGRLGAGTGAMRSQMRGPGRLPGGLGHHRLSREVGGRTVTVAALVAVNAFGDVDHGHPDTTEGALDALVLAAEAMAQAARGQTTIGVVLTDAPLDKAACRVVAQGAHDGLARALTPPHTRVDGDAFVAVSTTGPTTGVPVDVVRLMALECVARAVRSVDAS
ncbi:P1 family peptidase [Nocardioides sp. CFH 31398]|uniref:P1 family peptidase n=1 Tax=Nocardioides sp. CFH 31398 TaxID=2919579 RepID=UPI001F05EEAB|nr:P1 family peptidase [Nocardioides sp. CFH 31398]MCH1865655.1 P1 family peptidase [Nocardioides sp. CFH 31398]